MSLELATNNSAQKVIPLSMSLDRELMYGSVVARANNYISAQPEGPYTQNQIITIPLPMETLDLRSSTLQFTITGTPAGGATYTRFNTDIRSIFSRVAVRFGSKYVQDTQSYNLLSNVLNNVFDVNWAASSGALTTGTGSTVQRNADFLNPNKVYSVQLYHNEDEFFYYVSFLNKLSVQCYIDLYLSPANNCIETDVPGASYVVNNVQWHTASLVVSPSLDNLYNVRVKDNLTYTYFTYESLYDSSLLLAGTTKATKILSFKYSSVIGIIAVMQDSATLQSQTHLNKLNTFNFNNLNLAQIKIGNQVYPINSTASPSDLYTMWCETMGLSTRSALAGSLNYDSSNFVLALPLAKNIKEDRDINISLNGLNTSLGTSMQLELGFATPLASNQTLTIFCIIENTIKFNPNGSISFFN